MKNNYENNYESHIALKNRERQEERQADLTVGQEHVRLKLEEEERLRQGNYHKKKMIKSLLSNDKNMNNMYKSHAQS